MGQCQCGGGRSANKQMEADRRMVASAKSGE